MQRTVGGKGRWEARGNGRQPARGGKGPRGSQRGRAALQAATSVSDKLGFSPRGRLSDAIVSSPEDISFRSPPPPHNSDPPSRSDEAVPPSTATRTHPSPTVRNRDESSAPIP